MHTHQTDLYISFYDTSNWQADKGRIKSYRKDGYKIYANESYSLHLKTNLIHSQQQNWVGAPKVRWENHLQRLIYSLLHLHNFLHHDENIKKHT